MKIFVRQALMVFVGLFLAGTALVSSSCKSVSPAKNETVSIHKGKSVKEIVKTFDVKGRACVLADNLYGSVNVSYWNENKVEFRVVIEVDAASEKKKSEMLNSITIDFDEIQKLVNGKSMSCFSGKTRFSKSYSCRNCQTSIRYYICVPYNLENLSLKQKYGNVVIDADEINAETELSVMYGGIKAGNFKKPLSVVSSYSEIHIGSMAEKSEMKLQYCSSVKLGDSDRQLVLDAAYSDIDLGYIDHFTGNVIGQCLLIPGTDLNLSDCHFEKCDNMIAQYNGGALDISGCEFVDVKVKEAWYPVIEVSWGSLSIAGSTFDSCSSSNSALISVGTVSSFSLKSCCFRGTKQSGTAAYITCTSSSSFDFQLPLCFDLSERASVNFGESAPFENITSHFRIFECENCESQSTVEFTASESFTASNSFTASATFTPSMDPTTDDPASSQNSGLGADRGIPNRSASLNGNKYIILLLTM